MVGSISKPKNKTKQRTKVSCCGNSLKLAVSYEFKNRVSRTRLNETYLNPPLPLAQVLIPSTISTSVDTGSTIST